MADRLHLSTIVWLLLTMGSATVAAESATNRSPVDFGRDVQPILADHCYRCHGPDEAKRKGELRLDLKSAALRSEDPVIIPGHPSDSELIRRVCSADPEELMPPPSTKQPLTSAQIEILKRWIGEGAHWGRHWAFEPPSRPDLPAEFEPARIKSPIDAFIRARLKKEGLQFAPEADKNTLLRRVTLDLTGLPPTPSEVHAFVTDGSPDAYEKVVSRLLVSPRFGERMASYWLDAARYADTNGYQSDGDRFMWRWRDWVIDAFNHNKPFDQFTVEQLAGDLLPSPTLEQRIATGFNRNHRGNAEGGIIPEEYAVEYVVDRVDTTATVWLGLTIGCARCHDHKFDPITQREFYQLFAFFNNVPERGRAVKYGNSPPMIPAPTPVQQRQIQELDHAIEIAKAQFASQQAPLHDAQRMWEHSIEPSTDSDWSITRALESRLTFETNARFVGSTPASVEGKIGKSAEFDGNRYVDAGNIGDFGFDDKFTFSGWVNGNTKNSGPILSRTTSVDQGDGYSVLIEEGKIVVNLVKRWLDDALRVETPALISPGRWHHLAVSYDATRFATSLKIYVDGRLVPVLARLDELNQTFSTTEPFRIGAAGSGRFHGRIDDVRIYHDVLKPVEVGMLSVAEPVGIIASIPPSKRTENQANKLAACFLENHAPNPIRETSLRLNRLVADRERLISGFSTVMVMEDAVPPRQAYLLQRGQYDKPGEPVGPGVPAALPPMPPDVPKNRLGFARWLVNPANPLSARVAVNRFWQLLFGSGLVRTSEDFGIQGERPTHFELLDWLAVEFVRSGWGVKNICREIVTSATYRQDSRGTTESIRKDPENRFLSRGPKLRLSAEMIRDQALFASGLLVEQLGGPSVKPYQPAGLWKELSDTEYVQGHGADLHRRSLYTFWKRTVPPPTLMTFDAPGREACSVRQSRTNTPLQALALLNDVAFVEAARLLAERALQEGGDSIESRLSYAFTLVLARSPQPAELRVLSGSFRKHFAHYQENPEAARAMVRIGEAPRDDALDPAEQAAFMAIANVILAMDETITKG